MDPDGFSINDGSDGIPLLELHKLYEGELFAYYCKERRETLLVSLHFLPYRSQLCFLILGPEQKGNSPAGTKASSDKTNPDRNFANGGLMILDLPCLMVSATVSIVSTLFIYFVNRW